MVGDLLAAVNIGPVGFERPEWLILVPLLGVAVVWMAHRSLSGLGGATKWTAIGVRLLVILLVAGDRHRNGRSHMTRRLLGFRIDFRLWWPDTADRGLLLALRFGFGVKCRRHTAYRAFHIVGLVLKLT